MDLETFASILGIGTDVFIMEEDADITGIFKQREKNTVPSPLLPRPPFCQFVTRLPVQETRVGTPDGEDPVE